MGQIGFTPLQEKIFKVFSQEKTSQYFYFTGGTALSVFYLQHRISDDLDFFSERDFANESIIPIIKKISEEIELPYRFTQREKARIFEFVKKDKLFIKVDFVYYPYKRVEVGKKVGNIEVDSLKDIAANKLITINQREDVKDFVDLYFLLKKFTIWDLLYAVEAKFRMEMDMVLIAADFLKVEDFDYLPRMIKPLSLDELKTFFRQKAKEIGKRITV